MINLTWYVHPTIFVGFRHLMSMYFHLPCMLYHVQTKRDVKVPSGRFPPLQLGPAQDTIATLFFLCGCLPDYSHDDLFRPVVHNLLSVGPLEPVSKPRQAHFHLNAHPRWLIYHPEHFHSF